MTFSDLRKISDAMKYNLADEAIQEIINNVSGSGKREITWEQFNDYLGRKAERKNNSAAWLIELSLFFEEYNFIWRKIKNSKLIKGFLIKKSNDDNRFIRVWQHKVMDVWVLCAVEVTLMSRSFDRIVRHYINICARSLLQFFWPFFYDLGQGHVILILIILMLFSKYNKFKTSILANFVQRSSLVLIIFLSWIERQ